MIPNLVILFVLLNMAERVDKLSDVRKGIIIFIFVCFIDDLTD